MVCIYEVSALNILRALPVTINGFPLRRDRWNEIMEIDLIQLNKIINTEEVLDELIVNMIITNGLVGTQVLLSAAFNLRSAYWTYNLMYYLYKNQHKFGHVTASQGSYNKNHTSRIEKTTNHLIQAMFWIPSFGKDLSVKIDLEAKTYKIPKELQDHLVYKEEFVKEIEDMGFGALAQTPPSPSLKELGDLFPDWAPPLVVVAKESVNPKETPGKPVKENDQVYAQQAPLSNQNPMENQQVGLNPPQQELLEIVFGKQLKEISWTL